MRNLKFHLNIHRGTRKSYRETHKPCPHRYLCAVIEQFLNHIRHHQLLPHDKTVLLAVSGGVDSMVMLQLFAQAGFRPGVAHVNFQLRGAAADQDEVFVQTAVARLGWPCHTIRVDTKAYAARHGLSTQMAARNLRYDYFETLCAQHGYGAVATAHHLNDALETLLINLTRGTGLDGLAGLAVKNDHIIRPMLFANRPQIEAWAQAQNITWREDASNASDHYHRNLIRHHVIPVLQQINPALEQGFTHTLARLSGARAIHAAYLEQLRTRLFAQTTDDHIEIDWPALKREPSPAVILWELLKPWGFNYVQCAEMTDRPHQPGTTFNTTTHCLTVDRDRLMVSKRGTDDHAHHQPEEIIITQEQQMVTVGDDRLALNRVDKNRFTLCRDPAVAQLDADKITFPLIWRYWREGDRLMPLGMKQTKKISDLLIDQKIPRPEKAQIRVLEAGGQIVWVAGVRLADPFKVTPATQTVLTIRWERQSEIG